MSPAVALMGILYSLSLVISRMPSRNNMGCLLVKNPSLSEGDGGAKVSLGQDTGLFLGNAPG